MKNNDDIFSVFIPIWYTMSYHKSQLTKGIQIKIANEFSKLNYEYKRFSHETYIKYYNLLIQSVSFAHPKIR